MVEHRPPRGHPERPERLQDIVDLLRAEPVAGTRWLEPPALQLQQALSGHDETYLQRLESMRGASAWLDADTALSAGSLPAAWLAAGAAVEAVERVQSGEARNAFALVRPPGHHAERESARGFCLLNNVALAVDRALLDPGCERVLVVDWDVHHGNGTQHRFADREDVLFFSVHRHPFYPGTGPLEFTGHGPGLGRTINVPIDEPVGDPEYAAVFEDLLVPIAQAFDPDIVLVSAGFDAHEADPLGGMRVTELGFARLCAVVREIAARHCGGRLVLVLEGGYDLVALARSVHSCVEVLSGATAGPVPGAVGAAGQRILKRVQSVHRRWWPV